MMPHIPGYDEFCELRWPPDGAPKCPRCGATRHYEIPTRLKYKCAECRRQYSATTGTALASRKLPWPKMAETYKLLVSGTGPLELHRRLDIQYRAAWELCDKFTPIAGE